MIDTFGSRKGIALIAIIAIMILVSMPMLFQRSQLFSIPFKVGIPVVDTIRHQSIQNATWSNISKSTGEKILFLTWTTWYGARYDTMLKLFASCPELNCVMTLDRNLANESSAILFFMRDISWTDLPEYRRFDQYYVFQVWESPDNMRHIDLKTSWHRNFFNMTLTYRLDSTVPWPYGVFDKIRPGHRETNDSLTRHELVKIVNGKSKFMAWFVSNCKSAGGREKLVSHLQRLKASVDIYSYHGCGPLKCPRGNWPPYSGFAGASPCERILTKEYKFYLSLENSFCRDYVSEKLYSIMEHTIVIPIVVERKLVLDTVRDPATAQALNRSIIAVDDFPSVEKMYEYLKYLNKNNTAYLEYHQWRWKYQVYNDDILTRPGCELCRLVKSKKEYKINDIHKWWTEDANCHSYKHS